MKGIYIKECACYMIDSGHAHPDMIVERYSKDSEACMALIKQMTNYHCGGESSAVGQEFCKRTPACSWHSGKRYTSIHGPGGHIVAVR